MYTVFYWVGGSEEGKWKFTVPINDVKKAIEMKNTLNKEGYCAYVSRHKEIKSNSYLKSAPDNWDFAELKEKVS